MIVRATPTPLVPPITRAVTSPDLGVVLAYGWNPSTICGYGVINCPAGVGKVRVALYAGLPAGNWTPGPFSQVDVAFALETTPYDGVADYPGNGSCASGAMGLCNEGDPVPTFDSYAATILTAIQRGHPGTRVSFGLVDGFATYGRYDDADGTPFHVDIANFTASPTGFASELNRTLRTNVLAHDDVLNDSDVADNVLHGSAITAIYGALAGGVLNWTAGAHRVVVWIGSTAPRDPNYPENYSNWNRTCTGPACFAPTCEPSYAFVSGATSPNCEGWVVNQDANASHSIAALANGSEPCLDSAGFRCTIDVVNPRTVPTDAGLAGWAATNGTLARTDVSHVLDAGCDLSAATGGNWDGPSNFTCPQGTRGTLVVHWRGEPGIDTTFVQALENVSFGTVPVYAPALSGAPLVTFMPGPGVALAPAPNATVTCSNATVGAVSCPSLSVVRARGGLEVLTWNWSATSMDNGLRLGDRWSASFDLVVNSRLNGSYPIDRCDGDGCAAAGVGPVNGLDSAFTFRDPASGAVFSDSFGLMNVTVESPAPLTVQATDQLSCDYPPCTVLFWTNATGGVPPYSYSWDFGDGDYGSGADVNHTYTFAGEFTATASVRDSTGILSTQGLYVVILPVPGTLSVAVSASPPTATVGTPLELRASVGGGYLPLSFAWTALPPGCPTAGTPAIACRPTAPGNFTVYLAVTDGHGNSSDASVRVRVNPAMLVDLSVRSGVGCSGPIAPTRFVANVTGGTPPFAYAWDFGDGATSPGGSVVFHNYSNRLLHRVTVNVTDASGANASGAAPSSDVLASPCPPPPPASPVPWGVGTGSYAVTAAAVAAIGLGVGAFLYWNSRRGNGR